MSNRLVKKIPRFFGFRIYLSSTILYYWLILPFVLILTIKYAPDLRGKGQLNNSQEKNRKDSLEITLDTTNKVYKKFIDESITPDTLIESLIGIQNSQDSLSNININIGPLQVKMDEAKNDQATEEGNKINEAFNFLFNLLLISFLLGFIFNLPLKRYFSRKRKNKKISPRLFNFCKRFLLKSPLINAGILSLAYVIAHGYMLYFIFSENAFKTEFEESLFINLFYISLTASVLSLLFVYFWEKHRVHIKYIEHVFGKEELRKRIFNLKVGRIRNRMLISAAMTTLLPLTIVILYLFLSVTYLDELKYTEYTADQEKILVGDYMMFKDLFTNSSDDISLPGWLFYINAINSFFMFIGIGSSIFIAFVYILFFVKWTTQDIVHPVKELLANMKETGKGEMNNFGIVRTNDEIGELTEGYNEMTQKLGEYIQNISRMTDAYFRFVPRQFLDFLGKKSYVDIKLGDQVQKDMTVLFTDIRSFTEISEQMTPKENFDFINYYLGYMEPVIRNNNGFIDKFIGDSIMALFSDNAEDAINASIEMRIKLSQFNQVMDQFGKPAINSGIGIHSGSLMLGVVGGEGRMDGTVISDAVNLTSRLEGLTKIYGSAIIISQDTLIKLNDPTQYNYRFLDIVKVKGKKEAVYIFEIIDGDSDDIKQLKLKTKEQFAEGINNYKLRKFKEALKSFKYVHDLNNHDKTAELYLARCENFIKHGVPDDWDGIQTIKWN
ncbi:MAG: adenylate/guanylate cyclase domain-containing protein [Bacteroidetes bacterium]|nr:adenylate/guanylate cyclase domain-containing protein [Bacteroidota bacterium]MBL7103628.1 adenylate/guanylate cyclase domain-containing protein [Bacteroidales bacterium]